MAHHKSKQCDMGVGCGEYGACYAEAQGRPEMCPLRAKDCPAVDRAMIDFCTIPDEMDKDCWTLDFDIPPGARRISVTFNHGEKKIYVDGELYITFNKKGEGAGND